MSGIISLEVAGSIAAGGRRPIPTVRARINLPIPGTSGGLKLRLAQFVLSTIAICIAATIRDVHFIVAVKFFIAISTIHCIWTVSMALVNAHALLQSVGHSFHDERLLKFFMIGDAVTAMLVGLGALGLMGIVIVIVGDEEQKCNYNGCIQLLFASATGLGSLVLAIASFMADMIFLENVHPQ